MAESWPNLASVKDVYALFRDEMPLGRFLAPTALMLLCAVFMVWGAGFLWRELFRPVIALATGVTFQGQSS